MEDLNSTDVLQEEIDECESIAETEEERIKREKEDIRRRSARLRRRVIPIVAICMAILILLPMGLMLLLDLFEKDDAPQYRPIEFPEYNFDPVYDGDILEYEPYLAQNRRVYFYANPQGYGDRYLVTEEETDARLNLIYHYLHSIINGDAELYNGFFNQTYYQTHVKKEAFPQQMLYNMTVYFYAEEYDEESGEMLYTYQIDYMILKNNGKFRDDIGSNMIRPQYMILRKSANGDVKIENLILKKMAERVD